MTDIAELKRRANFALIGKENNAAAWKDYFAAANPAVVLELIAEIERQRRIESAALNLIAQRGHHNTEIAYRRLAEVMKEE